MSPELAELQRQVSLLARELGQTRRELFAAKRMIDLIRPHLFQEEDTSTTASGVSTQPVIVTITGNGATPGKYTSPSGHVWNRPELSLAPAQSLLDTGSRTYTGLLDVSTGVNYISELPIGATAAPKTLGDATEGSEAAEGTAWSRTTDAKALDLWVTSRVGYFDAGDEKLYGYARKLSFDALGLLIAVSAETRYEIDTPGGCP